MNSIATRRAFSLLSSKIHPQLPLSPRESEQLLALLTSSFRAHLDREHPVALAEDTQKSRPRKHSLSNGRNPAPHRPLQSSRNTANQHVESILTNPLFSVRPRRMASDPAKLDAQQVLENPLGWFLDQVAAGGADIPKAAMTLNMLKSNATTAEIKRPTDGQHQSNAGAKIAEWLWSSSVENSKAFLEYPRKSFLGNLIPLLLKEGEEAPLWRWFACSPQQRMSETGLPETQIRAFRADLLRRMVAFQARGEASSDRAIATFHRAVEMQHLPELRVSRATLWPSGAFLVDYILSHPGWLATPESYDGFLQELELWTSSADLIRSLLLLHHPTEPSAALGLSFLQHPEKFLRDIQSQKWLVQLNLGVARQLLAEQKYSDAQWVLEKAKEHFPELVSEPTLDMPEPNAVLDVKIRKHPAKRGNEQANLEMLDRLLPA